MISFLRRHSSLFGAVLILVLVAKVATSLHSKASPRAADSVVLFSLYQKTEIASHATMSLDRGGDGDWNATLIVLDGPLPPVVLISNTSADRCIAGILDLNDRNVPLTIVDAGHARAASGIGEMIYKEAALMSFKNKTNVSVRADTQPYFRLICRLSLAPNIESFTTSSIQVWSIAPPVKEFFSRPLLLNTIPLRDKLGSTLTGGSVETSINPEEGRLLPNMGSGAEPITIRWKDEERADERDYWLLTIGALLGIVLTLVIEWLKAVFRDKKAEV